MRTRVLFNLCMFALCILAAPTAAQAQSFYPLAIGNRWDYYSIGYSLPLDPTNPAVRDTFSVIVTDTVSIGGRLWHELNRFDLTGKNFGVYRVRADARGVYYLDARDSSEYHVYRLDSALWTSWQPYPGDNGSTVRYTSRDTADHFGIRSEERRFTLDGLIMKDVVLAEGIGLVYSWFGGEPPGTYHEESFLSGCIIDGVTRGKLLSSPPPPDALPRSPMSIAIYPNPACERVTIACDLQAAVRMRIDVFDALGRSVMCAEQDASPASRHSVFWNAGEYPAGVYLARITAGDATGSGKILVHRR